MGACCTGSEKIEEEIENCKSIPELCELLKLKYKEAEQEQKEINNYLEDKRNRPTLIEVNNLDDNMLQKISFQKIIDLHLYSCIITS